MRCDFPRFDNFSNMTPPSFDVFRTRVELWVLCHFDCQLIVTYQRRGSDLRRRMDLEIIEIVLQPDSLVNAK